MSRNQQSNALPTLDDIVSTLPFWTRCIYFGMLIYRVVDLLTGISSTMLACSLNTLENGYYWTAITSVVYVDSIFMASIIILNFSTFLPKLEDRSSSVLIIVRTLFLHLVIMMITLSIQHVLKGEQSIDRLNGIQGIWFNMLYKYCYFNGQRQVKFMCFDYKIKRNIYPFVLLTVCTIINWNISLPMIVGLGLAMLEVKIIKGSSYLNNNQIVFKIGKSVSIDLKCWICFSQRRHSCNIPDLDLYQNLQNYQPQRQFQQLSSSDSSKMDAFSSQRGIRIGDY